MTDKRCSSRWWKNGKGVARCHFPAGHENEHNPYWNGRHHNGTRTWRTFDNRWRSYSVEEMVEMLRVLTVQPPWAWAIDFAGKDVENRSQPTNWRGDVVILAGKTTDTDFDPEAVLDPRYPQNALLWAAAANPALKHPASATAWHAKGVALCVVRLVDCHEAAPGCCESPWAEHGTAWPFHWCFEDLRRLDTHLPARGNLGLRKPDPDLADAVGAQLAA